MKCFGNFSNFSLKFVTNLFSGMEGVFLLFKKVFDIDQYDFGLFAFNKFLRNSFK